MAHGMKSENLLPGKLKVSQQVKSLYAICLFVGVLVFILGLMRDPSRIWHSFLTSFFYFASLALGGLFFTALQHVSSAGWSVNVRRVMESLTAFLPWAALTAIGVYVGGSKLYVWLRPEVVKDDLLLQAKQVYLNGPFFAIRLAVFFGAWIIFQRLIVGNSLKQDQSGDDKLTLKNSPLSIAFLLVFALSYSLFSVDTLMSLQPYWYSTIWGVYCFSGLFQSTIAFVIILTVWLMKQGLLKGLVNENHLHDLGKYLKAFTVFYAYIAFSQFMLIWYANLPEETEFYLHRSHGGWLAISFSLLVFKFAIPFLLLLPRAAKRSPAHLVLVSVLILVMQYVDIFWMVYPNLDSNQILFSWQEVGVYLGFLGAFLWAVTHFLSRNALVPVRDPRRDESTAHQVTY